MSIPEEVPHVPVCLKLSPWPVWPLSTSSSRSRRPPRRAPARRDRSRPPSTKTSASPRTVSYCPPPKPSCRARRQRSPTGSPCGGRCSGPAGGRSRPQSWSRPSRRTRLASAVFVTCYRSSSKSSKFRFKQLLLGCNKTDLSDEVLILKRVSESGQVSGFQVKSQMTLR